MALNQGSRSRFLNNVHIKGDEKPVFISSKNWYNTVLHSYFELLRYNHAAINCVTKANLFQLHPNNKRNYL